jgi:hypothetical protein
MRPVTDRPPTVLLIDDEEELLGHARRDADHDLSVHEACYQRDLTR